MMAQATKLAHHELRSVAVYCGSKTGSKPQYVQAARQLGQELVKQRIKLVYGGGDVGLMGEVARTVLEGLGPDYVIGVIPEALTSREISKTMLGTTFVVDDMHQRKAMMAQHADGFIAMPGGYGTMEELLEVVTWQQLGYHAKPIGVLNTGGFFDSLLAFFQHCVAEEFIKPDFGNIVQVSPDPAQLLQLLKEYQAPLSVIKSASITALPAAGGASAGGDS